MTTMTIVVPEIHISARTVTVEVDETLVDRGRLVAAIEGQGYAVPA